MWEGKFDEVAPEVGSWKATTSAVSRVHVFSQDIYEVCPSKTKHPFMESNEMGFLVGLAKLPLILQSAVSNYLSYLKGCAKAAQSPETPRYNWPLRVS